MNKIFMDVLINMAIHALPKHTHKNVGTEHESTRMNTWEGYVLFPSYCPLVENPYEIETPMVYKIAVTEFYGDYIMYYREANDYSPHGQKSANFIDMNSEINEMVLKVFGNGEFAKTIEQGKKWETILKECPHKIWTEIPSSH